MIAKVCNRDGSRRGSFAEITEYIGHESKALAIRFSLEVFSLKTVAQEMELVASYSHRVGNPMYHYVLSWPASDSVTHDQMFASVERSIEKLGAVGHMWVTAIHGDSEFAHVHVILNRVHPETKKALGVFRSYLKLSEFCREQERANSWTLGVGRDRAGLPQAIDSRAVDGEVWTGHISFQRWVGGEPAAAVRNALATGPQTWKTVHGALAPFGLRYELYGRGATVIDAVGTRRSKSGRTILRRVAKASHLGNEFSLQSLERHLGPYRQNARTYETTQALTYDAMRSAGKLRSDAVRDPRIAPLFAQYEAEVRTWREDRQPRARQRAEQWAAHRRRSAARWNQFREERKRAMIAIQGPSLIPKPYLRAVVRFLLDDDRKELVATNRAERAAIFSEKGPTSLFRTWLKDRALTGDTEALAAARLLRIGIECEHTQEKTLSTEISGEIGRDETFDRTAIRNDYMLLLNQEHRDEEVRLREGYRDVGTTNADSIEYYRGVYHDYIGNRATPKVLWQNQFERERDREAQLLRDFKTQLAQMDGELNAQELHIQQSKLAMKTVLTRLRLNRTFEIERKMVSEVLRVNRIPSFWEFLEYHAVNDPTAKRLLPTIEPEVRASANFFVDEKDISERELVRLDVGKISYAADKDGAVTYTITTNGQQFQDRGARLDFEKVDRETIRLGLLMAREKWLDGIVLTGTEAFKEAALREAVQLDVTITNPELQALREDLIREQELERTNRRYAWLDKEIQREQSPVTFYYSYDAQVEAYLGAIEDAAFTMVCKGLTTSRQLARTNYADGVIQAAWTFGPQGFVLVENEHKAQLLTTTADHARQLHQQIGKHVDGLEREYKREQTHERDYSYTRSNDYSGGLSL